jgi:hypothetical protein
LAGDLDLRALEFLRGVEKYKNIATSRLSAQFILLQTLLKHSILRISLDPTSRPVINMHFITSLLLLPALAVAVPRTPNLGLRNLGVNPGDITIVSAVASGNGW